MNKLNNKIDFAMVVTVKNCNPNGDPLNGNRPRVDYSSYGEISDVCIKRKIRNRILNMGQEIFVQSDDNKIDNCSCLKNRYQENVKSDDKESNYKFVCEKWYDVRAFGQVFPFKSSGEGKGVSWSVRGPVSIQSAFSVDPVTVTSMQITKSVNSEPREGKSSDTMGTKHRVDFGVYKILGSINVELAQKTGFSKEDADLLKNALATLFRNDASSARPEGSMEVHKLYWWEHNCATGQHPTAKVHRSLNICKKDDVKNATSINDYVITLEELNGLSPEIIDGE